MTKLNNKLLSVFLCLAIFSCSILVYSFFKNEVFKKSNSTLFHTIKLTHLKIVKNNFYDSSFKKQYFEIRESQRNYSLIDNYCKANFNNTIDSLPYVSSSIFADIRIIETPFNIAFDSDFNKIPNSTINQQYYLTLEQNNKIIAKFNFGTLDSFLHISTKEDTVTQTQDVQITSSDKKVIAFISFTID